MRRKRLWYSLLLFAMLLSLAMFALASSKVHTTPFSSSASRALSSGGPLTPTRQGHASYGKLPLAFEPNQGQAGAGVKYVAHGDGYTLLLAPTEAILSVGSEVPRAHERRVDDSPNARGHRGKLDASITAVHLRFLGINRDAGIAALDELPGKSNYLIGTHPANWHVQIPTYATVKYENIYPGIDLTYHGSQGQLEYDFVVAPGADPRAIHLSVDPAKGVHLDSSGDVVTRLGGTVIRQRRPRVFQSIDGRKKEIAGGYSRIKGGEYAFVIGPYDHSQPLVVDPTLVYSKMVDTSTSTVTQLTSVAVDSSGNAYVTGDTTDPNFPTTSGAFQGSIGDTSCSSSCYGDAFVTKLNAAGTSAIYSTFLGGDKQDQAFGIAVDSSGNAYLTGITYSDNFPVTPGAFQSTGGTYTCTGGGTQQICSDAFVTVLNSTGTALIYSTYLGGSNNSQGKAIAVNSAAKVFVTGSASSTDFPTTPGAFETSFTTVSPGSAIFVSQIDPTQSGISSLVYSTFLGGNGSLIFDSGNGITADSSGQAYVTGSTASPNFATPGAFQTSDGESPFPSVFVAKLNPSGSALIYSTYVSGTSSVCAGESGDAIAIDSAGDAYVGGFASSLNFPATPGAFQQSVKGDSNGFVLELNPQGSALIYSTLLGGSYRDMCMDPFERVTALALDSAGDAYVAGPAESSDFPVTPDALELVCKPPYCGSFLTTINPQGTSLIFSTHLATGSIPETNGVAVDSGGNAYVTLGNSSLDKISLTGSSPNAGFSPLSLSFTGQAVGTTSSPQTVTLSNGGGAPLAISSIATSTAFNETNNCGSSLAASSSCSISVTYSPTSSTGFDNGTVTVTDNALDGSQAVQLSGTSGTPSVSLSVSSLIFASPGVGATSPAQTVTLTDSGTANLSITSIAATGDFAQTNTCGSSLGTGDNCTISVTFTPTVAGPRSGTLTIKDDAANSPQTVLLGGGLAISSGTGSATVSPGQMASYSLSITPSAGSQTATLSCSGAPAQATCSVPSSVTFSGSSPVTATATVTTTAGSSTLFQPPSGWFIVGKRVTATSLVLIALFVFIPLIFGTRRRQVGWKLIAVTAFVILLCVSCGGGNGGNSGGGTGGGSGGTPAGSYTLTITATSQGATATTTVQLTVH